MRNLEEYKTEIFRRSDEKIKRKKKMQKKVLRFGVPILCLSLLVGVLARPNENAMKTGENIDAENMTEAASWPGENTGFETFDFGMKLETTESTTDVETDMTTYMETDIVGTTAEPTL